MTFSTLLVANRGEIAVRIMRTAAAMGIKTVAVYSDADSDAAHVRAADVSVRIGPPTASESYLNIEAILDAARVSGAQAIHPGYGFLAENADFANKVSAAGLTFIGPPAAAIDAMGNKAAAKKLMEQADVPTIPGFKGAQDDATLVAEAKKIGMPVMVKAAAGGGGRGMRRVSSEAELASAISSARSEATNAFGSGELILEKALDNSRHVEVQIFADQYGNTVHMGERDCSVQRRHQKLIEESPSPAVDSELRERMGGIAVAAAKAVDYIGAGTVEFLLDGDGQFYFLEMNTRLQVEHPVTELVTGLDLVEWQLRIAAGESLPKQQSDINFSGHAIEVRICSEDPMQDFLPQAGPVLRWHSPNGDGIRFDHCLIENGHISPFYDSMQGKLIAFGSDRREAHGRLSAALQKTAILGTTHNTNFLQQLLQHPVFIAGDATTRFIEEHCPHPVAPDASHQLIAAALLANEVSQQTFNHTQLAKELQHWSSTGNTCTSIRFLTNTGDGSGDVVEQEHQCQSTQRGAVTYIDVNTALPDAALELSIEDQSDGKALVSCNGKRQLAKYSQTKEAFWLFHSGITSRHEIAAAQTSDSEQSQDGTVRASMDGKLLAIHISEGQTVAKGELVATLEAMKMEHRIIAPIPGSIRSIAAQVGSQLARNQLIIELNPKEA